MAHDEESRDLLRELVESSRRIEALLVAVVGGQNTAAQIPPAWRRRMIMLPENEDMDMIGMILNGTTAEEAAERIKERRAAHGPGGSQQ